MEVVAAAAKAGAKAIRAGFGHPQQVELKGLVDLVTETDRAAEAVVVEETPGAKAKLEA